MALLGALELLAQTGRLGKRGLEFAVLARGFSEHFGNRTTGPLGGASGIPPHMILITGGAGFVGSNLAISLARRHPDREIVALDNLHRPGSELNPPRLEQAGVRFVRGDVREPGDLAQFGTVSALLECSAEPSALSGLDGDTAFVFETNLVGAYNCLELARRQGSFLLFLSTSRVYPVEPLNQLSYEEGERRFELAAEQAIPGASAAGISEDFPLAGARTLYGTTKLAAEMLIEEYREMFGLPAAVDRCGVIAGPWQMGKVDQGVFAHWLLSHRFGLPLSYIGYGGEGKQVRDLIHVEDLADLVDEQLGDPERWDGEVLNVGGGPQNSLSLLEATSICRELTGNEVPISAEPEKRPGDVPIYVSDCARLSERTDWRPRRSPQQTLAEVAEWIDAHASELQRSLGIGVGSAG
jgi:CDP-paratose 2-epimerase